MNETVHINSRVLDGVQSRITLWNELSHITMETDPVSDMLCLHTAQNSRHVVI